MGNLQGNSPDNGYFYMDLAPLGISFPFMGRAEHELYISANGCELARDFYLAVRVSASICGAQTFPSRARRPGTAARSATQRRP